MILFYDKHIWSSPTNPCVLLSKFYKKAFYRTAPYCCCQFECKIISQFGQPPSSVWVEGWINLQLVGATSYMKETTKLNIKCKISKIYWLYIFVNDLNMLYCYRLNKQWLSGLALVSNQECLFTWLLWSPLGSLLCLIIPHCVVLVNFISTTRLQLNENQTWKSKHIWKYFNC